MKKKLTWAILIIVLISFASLYAIVDKTYSIFDTQKDTSEYVQISLAKNESLSQEFISKEEHLDGISLKMSVTGEANSKEISYRVSDENGNTVAQGETSLEELNVGQYFPIKFDRIENCKGEKYVFELYVTECEDEGNVIVYKVPGGMDGTVLEVRDQKFEGTLALRTMSHGFDLETFIVTVCFILYVVLFVKWLAKVFK